MYILTTVVNVTWLDCEVISSFHQPVQSKVRVLARKMPRHPVSCPHLFLTNRNLLPPGTGGYVSDVSVQSFPSPVEAGDTPDVVTDPVKGEDTH